MYKPNIWRDFNIPLNFEPVDIYKVTFSCLQEAKEEKWIELMYDFNDNIWWRRDLNEIYELGL